MSQPGQPDGSAAGAPPVAGGAARPLDQRKKTRVTTTKIGSRMLIE
jgi:hypothetical protein